MRLKRTYLEGWYHAFKWLYNSYKNNSLHVFKVRLRMWKQLVRKKHFWMTPEGRVKQMKDAFQALDNMKANIPKEAAMTTNKEYRNHPKLQQAICKLSDIVDIADDIRSDCEDINIIDETIDMINKLELMVNDVKLLIKNHDENNVPKK